MFGLNEALMSFIRRQVGLRTDAASASGSLHAKSAELRNYINTQLNLVQKPRGAIIGQGRTTDTAFAIILSVTGKGTLHSLSLSEVGYPFNAAVRITVDGTVLSSDTVSRSSAGNQVFYGYVSQQYQGLKLRFIADDICPVQIDLPFKSSLVVESKVGNSQPADVTWVYSKE